MNQVHIFATSFFTLQMLMPFTVAHAEKSIDEHCSEKYPLGSLAESDRQKYIAECIEREIYQAYEEEEVFQQAVDEFNAQEEADTNNQ